jgi:glucosamine--fructose-6-phosphate aminotransferase (isomerizing)
VAVVHNGVVENHRGLRRDLGFLGHAFRSDTDSEVIAHLVADRLGSDPAAAVRSALALVRGPYAVAVLSPRYPGLLVGACRGSPLALGLGEGEAFLASDPAALRGLARDALRLQDGQFCLAWPGGWRVLDGDGGDFPATPLPCPGAASDASLGVFPHHMLKEIHEQPGAAAEALRGRLDAATGEVRLDGLESIAEALYRARRVVLTGCGSSYHAALLGEQLMEELGGVAAQARVASEFRHRRPPGRGAVVVALTQSGETADTLAAVWEARGRGVPAVALCNAEGSSVARLADGVVPLRAGPEVAVASTKAFTNQAVALALLALHVRRARRFPRDRGVRQACAALAWLPDLLGRALGREDEVRRAAERVAAARAVLYLGRGWLYPAALEGALKLKEVAYVPAEGMAAGELKHGPLALVGPDTPCLFLAPRNDLTAKLLGNVEEVRARGGPVVAVCTEGDEEAARLADEVLWVPRCPPFVQPLVCGVPLQLLAYHAGALRGGDVDRPRHLAKSVTVE